MVFPTCRQYRQPRQIGPPPTVRQQPQGLATTPQIWPQPHIVPFPTIPRFHIMRQFTTFGNPQPLAISHFWRVPSPGQIHTFWQSHTVWHFTTFVHSTPFGNSTPLANPHFLPTHANIRYFPRLPTKATRPTGPQFPHQQPLLQGHQNQATAYYSRRQLLGRNLFPGATTTIPAVVIPPYKSYQHTLGGSSAP